MGYALRASAPILYCYVSLVVQGDLWEEAGFHIFINSLTSHTLFLVLCSSTLTGLSLQICTKLPCPLATTASTTPQPSLGTVILDAFELLRYQSYLGAYDDPEEKASLLCYAWGG
jgi:hypothetical protein